MELSNRVYHLLTLIPRGRVMTYGQISDILGIGSPRLVGRILHQNTDTKIPCYKVVFSDGRLAPNYRFGGQEKQKEKLAGEGVTFINNKVNLKRHQWSIKNPDLSNPPKSTFSKSTLPKM